ncbi:arginine N-methyltransferase [Cryptosporidium ubiquitum]|uniref:Arginine N-methyltransferase n=1 Tax=Cryptosporidium ubiquitum TaxID=857276 RepID=A0A1J4MMW8_9CRYT|nr:arginine N-methyltransferase [Cryptosporidium ubiquitum]OII75542.1 arginine N-methyltransferase [Cryptosporidium ubiquitum]
MTERCSKEEFLTVVNDNISDDDQISEGEIEMLEYDSYLEEFDSLSEAKCLFCDFTSNLTEDIWNHMKIEHEFDFSKETKAKEEYDQIRLINYLRKCVKDGLDAKKEYEKITMEHKIWEDDSLLTPVIIDDRLILELDTLNENYTQEDVINPNVVCELSIEEENKLLKQKIMFMANLITEFQNKESELDHNKDLYPSPCSRVSTASEQSISTKISPHELSLKLMDLSKKESEILKSNFDRKNGDLDHSVKNRINNEDTLYFSSYSTLDIHREMILDKVRTDAYYNFITDPNNSINLFKDKVVLDVGTGTGILSLFAVQSGAKMVVAVDAAKDTIKVAEKIAQTNNFGEKIHFICGKFEDLNLFMVDNKVISISKNDLPPKNSVPFECDIIISEWMGYCLLYESMLYTILDARNRYLKTKNGEFSGHIFPSSVRLQISLADYSDSIDSLMIPWVNNRLYNLDLSEISPKLSSLLSTPYVEIVPAERLRCKNAFDLPCLSILNITSKELSNLRQYFKIELSEEFPFFTSLVISFNAEFYSQFKKVDMETSPFHEPTHWKQTILHIRSPDDKLLKIIGSVSGYITITPRIDNSRHISILLELYNIKTLDNQVFPQLINHYAMN